MDLVMRQAGRADIPVLVQILNEANRYKLRHGDDIWGTEDWTAEEVRERLDNAPAYLFYVSNEVIGTAALQWNDEKAWGPQGNDGQAGYIHRLAIKEGFHGHDLGGKIMDWAAAEVVKNGRTYLRLDCPAENKDLCKYYESHGFKRVATKQNPMYGQHTAAYYQRGVSSAKLR